MRGKISVEASTGRNTLTRRALGDQYQHPAPAERAEKIANGELERLRSILAPDPRWPFWSANEAAWYFVGIDPKSSELIASGAQPAWYAFLPGAIETFSTDPEIRQLEAEGRHEKMSELCQGAARPPREWIMYLIGLHLHPPWTARACQDAQCRRLLGVRLVKKLTPLQPGEAPQSRGAKKRWADDPAHNAMRRIYGDIDDWLKAQPHDRSPHGSITPFAESLAAKLDHAVEMESIKNTILKRRKAWQQQLKNTPS